MKKLLIVFGVCVVMMIAAYIVAEQGSWGFATAFMVAAVGLFMSFVSYEAYYGPAKPLKK